MGDRDSPRNVGAQIRDWLRVLRERGWLIFCCLVMTVTAAVTYSTLREPVYGATARLLLEEESTDALIASGANQYVDPNRRAATNLELVTLPALASRSVKELRLPYSPEVLLSKVQGQAQADSNLIGIYVEDNDRKAAAAIANSMARQYIDFRREAAERRFTRALARLRTQIAQREGTTATGATDAAELKALRDQARQIELLASVQTGGAELIQPASTPGAPVRPKTRRNIILAIVFGLLLGVVLATLRDKLDRRIKSENDLRSIMPDVPIIAIVPKTVDNLRGRVLSLEGYRTLQTNLSFLSVDHTLRTFLVTSAQLGDGKTTSSLHLAWSMVERGKSALLVEADLRRPGLSERLGLQGEPGVSNYLSGARPFDDFLLDIMQLTSESMGNTARPGAGLESTGTLEIMPAGPIPPNPQALMSSAGLDELMEEAYHAADAVIFDGTPVGAFSDMLPLAKRVDGVILVVRLYHSRRDTIKRLIEQLDQNAVRPVGIVVFGASVRSAAETYYYAKG